jgi:hypothetical protein
MLFPRTPGVTLFILLLEDYPTCRYVLYSFRVGAGRMWNNCLLVTAKIGLSIVVVYYEAVWLLGIEIPWFRIHSFHSAWVHISREDTARQMHCIKISSSHFVYFVPQATCNSAQEA